MNPRHFLLCFAFWALVAGLPAQTPAGDPAPAAESADVIPNLFLSAGYASDYVFRGRNFGDNSGEGRGELTFPIGQSASLSVGGKFVTADGYEEAQGFASFQQTFDQITAAFGYRYYGLDADRQELGLMVGTALAGVDLSMAYFYDAEFSGHFLELMGQRSWKLMDYLSLRTGAGISAAADYWYGESGLNNAVFRVDLPVNLREWITLTPWISASLPLEALDSYEDNVVFGGINLQLSF